MAIVTCVTIALALFPAGSTANAPEDNLECDPQGRSFALEWWTVDAGGAESSGSTYIVTGSTGQQDAGFQRGDNFALAGGFWPANVDKLFADGFETGDTSQWSFSTNAVSR